jgi:hypothetical protein
MPSAVMLADVGVKVEAPASGITVKVLLVPDASAIPDVREAVMLTPLSATS